MWKTRCIKKWKSSKFVIKKVKKRTNFQILALLLKRKANGFQQDKIAENRHFISKIGYYYTFSMISAEAPPPPLQMAAIPTLASLWVSTLLRVVRIRAPEAPSG